MVQRKISLKQLQRVVARERFKVASLSKREKLERELRMLKRSGRTDIGGRVGRGFVILSKKVGKVALKQAQLIRERQIQEARRTKKKTRGRLTGGFDPLGSLDF